MTPPQSLSRTIGLGPAILIGLGSILGTGVYVGLGLAAGAAGDWIYLAILIAAVMRSLRVSLKLTTTAAFTTKMRAF